MQVVENAVAAVKHLRSLGCNDIEFSPEDAGRSDPEFLYQVGAACKIHRQEDEVAMQLHSLEAYMSLVLAPHLVSV